MTTNNPPASSAPMIGPTTGIGNVENASSMGLNYFFVFAIIVSIGPKSLAGLIAYPVNPPSDIPM